MSKRAASSSSSGNATKKVKTSGGAKSETNQLTGSFGLVWEHVDDHFYMLNSQELPHKATKIAAFDMDWTIVRPKKGKFAKGRSDWVWWKPQVPQKLKQLHAQGFKIVLVTNQGGIEKGKCTPKEIQGKILDLCDELGFPMAACICGGMDHWRKPSPHIWTHLIRETNAGVQPKADQGSFFCGDACGRRKGWQKGAKKDFSCSDRAFAHNTGLPFKTCDDFFLDGQTTDDWDWDSIDPQDYLDGVELEGLEPFEGKEPIAKTQLDVVMMVGYPASGKTFFAQKHLVNPAGYEWINRDTLKTPAKCLKAAKAALAAGKNVVIDNTGANVKVRAPFVNAAKAAGAKSIRAFVWQTPREVCHHLNWMRVKKSHIRRVPDVAFHTFKKRLEEPTLAEGFTEIAMCHFVPEFDDDQAKELFLQRT